MALHERLGFIGLGIMGFPMAENLLKAGHALTVYNRSSAKAQQLGKRGAALAGSPAEVGRQARVIFISVGDTQAVQEVCGSLLQGVSPGAIVVDISTISPDASRNLAEQFRERGVSFLDAPCTGSKAGATSATLTFIVGGEQEAFEQAQPYLAAMGKKSFHVGGNGTGLQVKLTQNLIGALTVQAMAEGFVLARKAGLSPSLVLEVLQSSVARNPLIEGKLPLVLGRRFEPDFSLKWMHKDLTLMLESARRLEVPLPVTALVHELFGAGVAMGHGEEDFVSAVRVLEMLAGVEVTEIPLPEGK
ncbi:MAG: NAD(P)-dependent oxidoreductase [Acidobacteria bacterium]|nr:NAD(P)-dependent oxidoreductase [Acidobacteriota bacterium]